MNECSCWLRGQGENPLWTWVFFAEPPLHSTSLPGHHRQSGGVWGLYIVRNERVRNPFLYESATHSLVSLPTDDGEALRG